LNKGNSASVSNDRSTSILINFSKLFNFVINDHVSHYLLTCFTKPKSITTNFVTYLEFVTALVGSQLQADTIYFDLTSAFDLVPHTLLLHKLIALGLPGGCVNWFRSYLTNRQSQVRVSGTI
jgi:hypothetical protein